MFWDVYAPVYDLFENIFNGVVYQGFSRRVADRINKNDDVLECAVGTGVITSKMAPRSKSITGIDLSREMLKKAAQKCAKYNNVALSEGNIKELNYADNSFDKVVAGNVIHLIDEPEKAIAELYRVCKAGGEVIIPTYISAKSENKGSLMIKILRKMGAEFKAEFTEDSYKVFFEKLGYSNIEYEVVKNGMMANEIAIIHKN